jgi:hypothetical protein
MNTNREYAAFDLEALCWHCGRPSHVLIESHRATGRGNAGGEGGGKGACLRCTHRQNKRTRKWHRKKRNKYTGWERELKKKGRGRELKLDEYYY